MIQFRHPPVCSVQIELPHWKLGT